MILICDDDITVRTTLTLVLKRAGYQVAIAANREEAIDFVRHTTPRLVLMDMNYTQTTTGEEGLALLSQVKVFCPDVPVILITAWGSIDLAVRGIRAGAFDFITKPWNNLALLKNIETVLQLQGGNEKKGFDRGNIIGNSPLLRNAMETVARIASTNASVLITGESGTGKELIAEAIHRNSNRSASPFVKVNLGGISQSLFESEMFGHKKGAFTDATYDRAGRFELADKGTIFLDEIGELDMVCQVKLLRVLQEQTFEPLGESRPRQVDTRIVCATNRSLINMVSKGTFREDLFYRINLITIHVPALRERKEDIPLLVRYFAEQLAGQTGGRPVEFTDNAILYLQQLPYPGNIRELKNLVDRTILVSGQTIITERELREQYIELPTPADDFSGTVQSLEQVEKTMIQRAVSMYGANHSRIALALGISRQALYRRLEKYNLILPE